MQFPALLPLAGQQQVEHCHEVRFARPERPVEIAGGAASCRSISLLVRPPSMAPRMKLERLVEGAHESWGVTT